MTGLQKANFGKRIIAAIFDGILLSVIAVGLIALLSVAFNTDKYLNSYQTAYTEYSEEYGLNLSADEYNELTAEQKDAYDQQVAAAEKAFSNDEDAVYAYNMYINLSLIIITFGILISALIIEFIVPLLFGNGQTLGKKIFGIALMHTDGIKVKNIQMFIRSVLGKFTIELMIPVYIIMMIFFDSIGTVSIIILAALLIIQIICLATSRTNSLLHDVLAGTVAVDMASQKIFENREELLEYTKKHHAEKANAPTYK